MSVQGLFRTQNVYSESSQDNKFLFRAYLFIAQNVDSELTLTAQIVDSRATEDLKCRLRVRRQAAEGPKYRSCLTQCIDEMVSESQLPHEIVNLLFATSNSNKRRILGGVDFLEPFNQYIARDMIQGSL